MSSSIPLVEKGPRPVYYEKSRASAKFMNCQVCLDNFFGTRYLEIEGPERSIRHVISTLGLEDFPIEKRSYLELLNEVKNEGNRVFRDA